MIWGNNNGFFDKWSLVHFTYFFMIFTFVSWFIGGPWWLYLMGAVFISYFWEGLELHKNMYESFLNRWISDPMVNTAGAMLGWFIGRLV